VPALDPVFNASVSVPDDALRVSVTEDPELRDELLVVTLLPPETVQLPPVTERVVVGLDPLSPALVRVKVVLTADP
jgi:hypothetical protein